jgi:hypothetical protein
MAFLLHWLDVIDRLLVRALLGGGSSSLGQRLDRLMPA